MLNRLIFLIISFVIFFTPLAFGTVHLWSETVLEISILLALFLYILKSVREGAVISYRRNILNVFFACLVLYIACQLRFGLTECPYQTYLALKLASSLFGLFFVVTNVVDTRRSIDKILFLITLAGFLVSVLGIIQLVTSTDKIYWVRSFPDAGFFASFIY